MWEVGGLNPGHGTVVGFFKVTGKVFLHRNLFRISPCSEAGNYRPYTSPSFEVAKPCKITAILAIIIMLFMLLIDASVF